MSRAAFARVADRGGVAYKLRREGTVILSRAASAPFQRHMISRGCDRQRSSVIVHEIAFEPFGLNTSTTPPPLVSKVPWS